jgi:anti-sigma B factor antagonist
MRCTVDVEGRTIRLHGDLDLASAPGFDRAVAPLTDLPGDIVIEMDGVDFLDSSGLRSVFDLAKAIEGRGRVVVRRPTPQARRVLELVRAELLVEVRPD